MQKKTLKNNGFTLIEVLIALVLLLIMSLGTLYGLSKTMAFISQNQYREQAKQVAQSRMDGWLQTPYDQLDPDKLMKGKTFQRFFGESMKDFTITENLTTFDNATQISVTVSWKVLKDNTKEETLTLTSIRGNR